MNNTEILKNIFDLAKQGKEVDLSNLPSDISKEVVEKNLLYIELKNLVKNNGDPARIEEIKSILYPPQEENEPKE
jgi:hypothetical protein